MFDSLSRSAVPARLLARVSTLPWRAVSPGGDGSRGGSEAAMALPATREVARGDTLAASWVETIATYLELMKLRLVSLLVLVAVTSAIAAKDGMPDLGDLVKLILAGTLASAGAGALNHYLDRDRDSRMGRTRRRPLPAGKVSPKNAMRFGILLVILGMCPALQLGFETASLVLLGAAVYVGVYTIWLKPSSPWSVVIGSLSGTCATLAGWSIGGSLLSWGAFWTGMTLFLWSPPHFWLLALARREDYAAAGFPTLVAVAGNRRTHFFIWTGFLTTVISAVALGFSIGAGWIYMAPVVLLGGWLVVATFRLGENPAPRRCIALFGLSMTFMAVSYVALALNALLH